VACFFGPHTALRDDKKCNTTIRILTFLHCSMSNLLKGIFVSLLPLVALILSIVSCIDLFQKGFSYTNLGTLISSATITFLFASIFIVQRARTSPNLLGYSFIVSLGILVSIAGIVFLREANFIALWPVVLMGLMWWMYVRWYSIFDDRDTSQLQVGHNLPRFNLVDEQGEIISSSDLVDHPRIWMFYRGNWCPLCMAQIKEISKAYQEIENRGAKVALISPQPHRFTKGLAKKHEVKLDFFNDPDAAAAKELGLHAKSGTPTAMLALGYDLDTVLPTIVITDVGGEIIYADLTDNYRVRPEPQEFLKILDQMKAA